MHVIDQVRERLAPWYRVDEEVGRGGSAYVFRAWDTRHNRDVAIKVLEPTLWSGSAVTERFQREIRIVSTLRHPNILPLFDSGDIDGVPFFVMPFVSGETLRDRLKNTGPLTIDEAVGVCRDVADALGYAHREGIIHRDIKPGNIMLFEGRAVIADFGIARALNESADTYHTTTGHAPGTPGYMSPEQAGGEEVDARSDVYSLGCVMYEVIAGEPPFTGRTVQAIIARQMQEAPRSLEVVRPSVPGGVIDAIEKSLSKVPADRFQSAEQLAGALEEGRTTLPRSPGYRRQSAGRLKLLLTSAIVLAIAASVLVASLVRPPALDDNRVVVFPFVQVGQTDTVGIGWDVALAIGIALEHTEPLTWIDGWEWLSREQRQDPALVTSDVSRQIASEQGAGRYMSGAIRAAPGSDSVDVTVRVYGVQEDAVVQETERAPVDRELSQVALAAVVAILPRLIDPGRSLDLTAITDRAPGAVALTVQGDRAYRESRFADAFELYRRAVRADSFMAIAAARGATAAVWEEEYENAIGLAHIAVRQSALLPERHRHLVRGIEAYLAGQADTAVARLEAALAAQPDWTEAASVLGEVYYHLIPPGGETVTAARGVFEDIAERDETFTPALHHLTEIALREGRTADARRFIDQLAAVAGRESSDVERFERMADCVEGSGSGPESWFQAAVNDPGGTMTAGLALAPAQPRCAEQAFQALRTVGGAWTWGSTFALQSLWLAQGRIDETVALLREALEDGLGAVYPLSLFDAGISSAFDPLATEAEQVSRRAFGPEHEGANPISLWLMGVWFAVHGDAGRTERFASRVESHLGGARDREVRLLTDALTAHAALARGDDAAALTLLSELEPTGPLWRYFWEFHEALAPERIRLARALLAKGDHDGAIRVASVFDHPASITYLAYLAPSLAIRLRAADALGRTDLVGRYRQRLERLGWSNAVVPLSMTGPLLETPPTKEPK